jgi:hypothetical protein
VRVILGKAKWRSPGQTSGIVLCQAGRNCIFPLALSGVVLSFTDSFQEPEPSAMLPHKVTAVPLHACFVPEEERFPYLSSPKEKTPASYTSARWLEPVPQGSQRGVVTEGPHQRGVSFCVLLPQVPRSMKKQPSTSSRTGASVASGTLSATSKAALASTHPAADLLSPKKGGGGSTSSQKGKGDNFTESFTASEVTQTDVFKTRPPAPPSSKGKVGEAINLTGATHKARIPENVTVLNHRRMRRLGRSSHSWAGWRRQRDSVAQVRRARRRRYCR